MKFRHPNQERGPSKQGVRLGPYFGVGDNLVTLGTGAGGVSPLALKQRDGSLIRDRASNTIQVRS